jgi:hypothetical protein
MISMLRYRATLFCPCGLPWPKVPMDCCHRFCLQAGIGVNAPGRTHILLPWLPRPASPERLLGPRMPP